MKLITVCSYRNKNTLLLVLVLICFNAHLSYTQQKIYKYPGNPVFQEGDKGDWDEVLYDFDILFENNQYRMWYIGFESMNPMKRTFGLATSIDGINWKKYEKNPLDFNSDNLNWGNVFGTFDIIREDSLYLLWYSAQPFESGKSSSIGFAWSEDGFNWTNHPNPVLCPGEDDAWDSHGTTNPKIYFDGRTYHLWYCGWPKRLPKTVSNGYATSTDGINWEKHPDNPVLTPGVPGNWDDQWAVGYSVIFNDSLFEMWYFGWDLITFEIGKATSSDGILWNKSEDNPILKAGETGEWDAALLGPRVLIQDSKHWIWYAANNSIDVGYGYATNDISLANNWKQDSLNKQQRSIRVQVFNNLQYINVDSLSYILDGLSGTDLIDAYNKLALAWSLNDEKQSYSYASIALDLAIKENYARGKAMALYSMGINQYVRNNYSAALTNQLTALRLFDSLNMFHEQANLLSQIASIHSYAGSHALACKYYQESFDVFSIQQDTTSMLNVMNYLGMAFLDAGDTMLAIEIFREELKLAQIYNQLNAQGLAYEGLGKCFQQKSLDSSLYYITNARIIWENDIQLKVALNLLLMTETYLSAGPEYNKDAEEYLRQTFILLLNSVGGGEHQLRWCYRMAELKIASEQYNDAKEYLDLAFRMCNTFLSKYEDQQYVSLNDKLEFGILLKEYKEKINVLYYKFYLALNDKDKALQHFILATAWNDSVANDRAWKKVSMIEGQYETEKVQSQITVLEKDNKVKNLTLKKSRIFLYGLGTLVLVIIFIAFIYIRNRRIKAQYAIELEKVKSEKLQEMDRLKSRFFANISHEFRTPLTLIMGPLDNLLSKASDTVQKKDLNIAKKYTKRLQHLISQLLTISKLESGKMQLHTHETNLVKLVRMHSQSFESLAKQKDISLSFTTEKDDIQTFVDTEKMEQILTNLLSNAFKFTATGGMIKVEIATKSLPDSKVTDPFEKNKSKWPNNQKPKQYAQISVSDTGCGIARNHIDHVFDRFYQVEHEDNKYEGTGIGLALTKELVELHQGIINVESEEGKGSVFSVSFLLGNDHLKKEEIIENEPENSDSSVVTDIQTNVLDEGIIVSEKDMDVDDSQAILLIVEDNTDMRSYIRGYFENEYHIIEAVDGADGYEKSTDFIPDLIISDVMMPRMDGNEFCRRVKLDERTSHIPIIMLTARAAKESRIEGLRTGADDFITKPFDGEELQVRVRNLIEQRERIGKLLEKKIQKKGSGIHIEFEDSGITSMDERFLQKVIDIIKERYTDPQFSIKELGEEIGLGRIQLNRKIKGLTGQTTVSFIRTFRLNRAAELIKKESATVAEIAYSVGFNSPSYFTECFSQYFGQLPTEYTGKL